MLLCATPASFQHPYVHAEIRKANQAPLGRARQAECPEHGDRVGARRVGHGRLAQPPPVDPRQELAQALHRLQHRLWPRARSDISAHTLPGRAIAAQPVKAWSYRACPKPRLQHGVWRTAGTASKGGRLCGKLACIDRPDARAYLQSGPRRGPMAEVLTFYKNAHFAGTQGMQQAALQRLGAFAGSSAAAGQSRASLNAQQARRVRQGDGAGGRAPAMLRKLASFSSQKASHSSCAAPAMLTRSAFSPLLSSMLTRSYFPRPVFPPQVWCVLVAHAAGQP